MAGHKQRSFDAFLSSTPILSELLEHIDVGTKWYLLGTLLHVDDKRLDGIDQSQGHDDTSKTLRMFQHWLTTTPTASRRQVLEALRKRVISEHTVADKYEKYLGKLHNTTYTPPSTKAVSILKRNIQSLNEALVSPVQVSQLLYCKRCISEATLDEMERMDQGRSLDDKKTTLLTAIQETVSSDYRKFIDITTVLSDVEETRTIANEMMTNYEEKIPQDDDNAVVQEQEVESGNEDRASNILRNNYSALSQSITEPVRMARLLHEEVISDEALSHVISTRGSVFDSRAVLLKAVRDAVHSNYKHLELFVTILRKFSETAHIGNTIFEEYRQKLTDHDDVEEMETYLTEKKRKSQISSCSSSNSEFAEDSAILGHKILFPRDMRNEFKDMRVKFGSTFYDVRLLFSKKWGESQSDINNVKVLLIDIFPDLMAELSVAKTIDGVLDVVKRKCSIIDIRPLEVLAQKFEVKEAEAIIREHKEAAEKFCKSVSVDLFQDQTLQVIPTRHLLCETITFVLNWNPDETTLQDINDVLLELKVLHKYQIKVVGVGTGSVIVTCYCPAEYTSSLIVIVLKKIEILQERGLTDFIVGNCTIWNNIAHEVSEMTNKEIDQITKSTVIDYEDTEKELRQQLAQKNRKILELQQEKQQAHLLPAGIKDGKYYLKTNLESNDELNKKLETQFAISRRKRMEIEDLKATVRQKEDKIIATEKELVSLRELSENQLQEIEQLKLKLNDKNDTKNVTDKFLLIDIALPVAASMTTHTVESDNEVIKSKGQEVTWYTDMVQLTNPSVEQCKEVISELKDTHQIVTLSSSSADIANLLLSPLLTRTTCAGPKQIYLYSTPLTENVILPLSVQLSNSHSLKMLGITNGSISDDEVITLAQSLKNNKKLVELQLDHNPGITSTSVLSLVELLLNHQKLSKLYLDHTNIDTGGILMLVDSLKTNKTLQKLSINKEHEKSCCNVPDYELIQKRIKFV